MQQGWRGPTASPLGKSLSPGEGNDLQLQPVGIGHERGGVAGAVLRIFGGGVEANGALLLHQGIGAVDVIYVTNLQNIGLSFTRRCKLPRNGRTHPAKVVEDG